MNFFFNFFLFIICFNSFILSYIVIPFNTYDREKENPKEEFSVTKFFENYKDSLIYIRMKMGNPVRTVPVNIFMNFHGLILGYLNNNDVREEESTYNINRSSTFYGDSSSKKYYSSEYPWGFIGQDTFTFFSDIKMDPKEEIKLNNISFLYIPKNTENMNNKINGVLGLSLKAYYYVTEEVNFFKILKKLNHIQKFDYSFHFTSDTEGLFIIGEEPHNYMPNMFNINNLRRTNSLFDGVHYGWKIEFSQIYFYAEDGIKQNIKEKNSVFSIEKNYIYGSKTYKQKIEEKYFKQYLDNNICHYGLIEKEKYQILICDKTKSFDISSFPTLYFIKEYSIIHLN